MSCQVLQSIPDLIIPKVTDDVICLGDDRSQASERRRTMGERDYVYYVEMELWGFNFFAKRRAPGDLSVSQPWLEHTEDSIIGYSECFDDQDTHTLTEVLQELPTGEKAALVTELQLGHDGIIFANTEKSTDPELIIGLFVKVLERLPNLVQIDYCGYYSDFRDEHITEAARRCGRSVWPVTVW